MLRKSLRSSSQTFSPALLQDPEVIHSPLPVFQRPPSIERDTTIMRPRDPDRMVLTVEPPKRYLEPDSPNSMDQLISPQSPDFDNECQKKKSNLNGSSESLDQMFKEDERRKPPVGAKRRQYSYKPVFNYEVTDPGKNKEEEHEEYQSCILIICQLTILIYSRYLLY